MVEGTGFEPVYAMRADLQSAAFNHSATPPQDDLNHHKITTALKPQYGHLFTLVKRIFKKKHIAHKITL